MDGHTNKVGQPNQGGHGADDDHALRSEWHSMHLGFAQYDRAQSGVTECTSDLQAVPRACIRHGRSLFPAPPRAQCNRCAEHGSPLQP